MSKCKNGHDKSESYVGYDGTMVCRTCRSNRVRKYRMNKVAKLRKLATAEFCS